MAEKDQSSHKIDIIYSSSLVFSVSMYGTVTGMLRTEENRLQSFHITCQHKILNIQQYGFVYNVEVLQTSRLHLQYNPQSMPPQLCDCHHSPFGHITHMSSDISTHLTLLLSINTRNGIPPAPDWQRSSGDHTKPGCSCWKMTMVFP